MDGKETVSLVDEVNELKEGESIVAVSGEASKGYYLHIGDKLASNRWAVTLAEMLKLRDLLNKKFGSC